MDALITNGQSLQQAQSHVLNRKKHWAKLVKTNKDGVVINNNGTVHHEDFIKFATDSEKYRRFENVVVDDLIAAGLSTDAAITDTLIHFQTMNKFDANVSMNGSNKELQQTDYVDQYIPLPIFTSVFKIPFRQGAFAYKQADGMMEAFAAVNALQDTVMVKGADLGVMLSGTSAPLYGFTNHPATITETILDWSDSTNATKIAADAVKLAGRMFNGAKVSSPNTVMMYVANDVWTNLESDYAENKGDRTNLERIKAISCIQDVKPQKDLADGSVLLVEMHPRTVQIAVAQQAIAVPHVKENDLDDGKFTVYSAMTPKIKTDRAGVTGIVYGTKA